MKSKLIGISKQTMGPVSVCLHVGVKNLSIIPFPNFLVEIYGLPANYSLVSLEKYGGECGHWYHDTGSQSCTGKRSRNLAVYFIYIENKGDCKVHPISLPIKAMKGQTDTKKEVVITIEDNHNELFHLAGPEQHSTHLKIWMVCEELNDGPWWKYSSTHTNKIIILGHIL